MRTHRPHTPPQVLGSLVLGGAALLERRLPTSEPIQRAQGAGADPAEDGRWWKEDLSDAVLCECTPDEALGLALALGSEVYVERDAYEAAALPPTWTLQRSKMRLELEAPKDGANALRDVQAPMPWEIKSADDLFDMPREIKARAWRDLGARLAQACQS